MKNTKFRTIIGLALLYTAVLFNIEWIWAILFLFWVIPDLFSGTTYFIEPVEKKSHPFLYWIIISSWIWMSIYMLASPFLPQLNVLNYNTTHSVTETGKYVDQPIIKNTQKVSSHISNLNDTSHSSAVKMVNQLKPKDKTITQKEGNSILRTPIKKASKENLDYKTFQQKEDKYYIGITLDMNTNDPDLTKHTNELWDSFYQNDISPVIPNIIDERIYFIYSPTDQKGNYKATIAYQTQDINDVYEGLNGIKIPPSTFAVIEQKGYNAETFVTDTWEKVYNSNLNFKDGYNLEVYELNQDYSVKNSEIRISIY